MGLNAAGTGLAAVTHGLENDQTDSLVAPGTPTLSGVALSTTSIQLTWTFGTFAEYYYLERKLVGGAFARVPDASTTFTTYTYTDTGLTANTAYVYRVTAYNVKGTGVSAEVTVTTAAASAAPATAGLYNFFSVATNSDGSSLDTLLYTNMTGTLEPVVFRVMDDQHVPVLVTSYIFYPAQLLTGIVKGGKVLSSTDTYVVEYIESYADHQEITLRKVNP